MKTGPTQILQRCPWCKELFRLDENGRFPQHNYRVRPSSPVCEGSGKRPDPTVENK